MLEATRKVKVFADELDSAIELTELIMISLNKYTEKLFSQDVLSKHMETWIERVQDYSFLIHEAFCIKNVLGKISTDDIDAEDGKILFERLKKELVDTRKMIRLNTEEEIQ